jgi:DNA-binding transcriptional MerR regulator
MPDFPTGFGPTPGTGQIDQNAPVEQTKPTVPSAPASRSGELPPTPSGAGGTPGTGAPTLPAPVTGLPKDLDVEGLIKLISEQSRKELAASTIESIKTKGQRKLDGLKEQIEQIKKQMEEANKPTSLLKKIFGWIGVVASVIASVAAVVATAGAATPLLVGACIMAGVAVAGMVDQIMQEASGGNVSMAKGFSKMLQAFGVDEKKAEIAGMAVVGGLMLVGTIVGSVMTMGAGSGAAISNISKMAKMIKTVAAVTQCALAITNASLTIAGAVSQYKSDMAGVKMKEIQALLEQLKALTEQEEDFLKVMMEEEQLITQTVQKIVEGLQGTELAILTGGEGGGGAAAAPSMA